MSQDYTPVYSAASERAYSGRVVTDPLSYTTYDSKVVSAKYIGYELINEILALWRGAVAAKEYEQVYTCIAGLNVGDPVYISANNTATLALATTDATAKVFGFCAYKPTTTSCYIDHFRYKSGLSGLTANSEVFLTNAGAFSATAGTVRKVVGVALSTTEALLMASPITSQLSPPFVDTQPLVKGSADATKLMRFEVDGFTTGNTRVITPPDSNFTMAGINIAQTFTALQTFYDSGAAGIGAYFKSTGSSLRADLRWLDSSGNNSLAIGPDPNNNGGSQFFIYSYSNSKFYQLIDSNQNVGFAGATSFGTSAVGNIGLASGTAPTTSPADYAAMWVADLSAGNAGWWVRGEGVSGTGMSWAFGQLVGSTTWSALYANGTPASGNYIIIAQAGQPTFFNAVTSYLGLGVAGTTYAGVASTGFVIGNTTPATGTNILKIENGTAWTSVADAVALRSADSAALNANLWAQNEQGILKQITGLDAYVSSNVTNDSATLADITGLSINVAASTKYKITAVLNSSTGATLEGIQVCITGTATATNIIADVSFETHEATPVLKAARISAMAGTADAGALVVNGSLTVYIDGMIEVANAGTLKLQMAKSADTGAANTTVYRDSTLCLECMA